jgi:hypothetical protein
VQGVAVLGLLAATHRQQLAETEETESLIRSLAQA